MSRLSVLAVLLIVFPLMGEERTFSVAIDGKPGGTMVLEWQRRNDGATSVTLRADYRLEGPTAYGFDCRGTEMWKDGRLVRFEGLGSENGIKGGITLVAGKDAYALKAGVKEVRVRGEVWPTTGMMPPEPDRKPLVVDAITGDVLHAKVEKVGADRIEVAGKLVATTHYRVIAGASRWDVWYDENNCLAKRVWMRDGRTVIAHVTHIKAE
jgi:Family of unknown function (DUF6134)